MRNEYSRTKRQNDINHVAPLPNNESSDNLIIIKSTWQVSAKKLNYREKFCHALI